MSLNQGLKGSVCGLCQVRWEDGDLKELPTFLFAAGSSFVILAELHHSQIPQNVPPGPFGVWVSREMTAEGAQCLRVLSRYLYGNPGPEWVWTERNHLFRPLILSEHGSDDIMSMFF